MEANGAILGVSLIIDDVLSSGRDAAPLQLQTAGDPDITTTSDREVIQLKIVSHSVHKLGTWVKLHSFVP